jgi:hypothetical protein
MRKKYFAITQRFQCHAADLCQHSFTQSPWELNGFLQSEFRLTALQQGSIRVKGREAAESRAAAHVNGWQTATYEALSDSD